MTILIRCHLSLYMKSKKKTREKRKFSINQFEKIGKRKNWKRKVGGGAAGLAVIYLHLPPTASYSTKVQAIVHVRTLTGKGMAPGVPDFLPC